VNVARLDRPGTRTLLAVALRVRIRQLYGVSVPVHYERAHGHWLFHWPDTVVPTIDPIPTSPWDFEAAHADVFFQQYEPHSGDVIVDLGAGIGSELELMCRLVGAEGAVYAIEADPLTFSCLHRRRELNRLTNAVPVHVAVSDAAGEVVLSGEGHHLEHHVVDDGPGARVPATTLDAFVASRRISHIDLLKVNIEGSEEAALRGGEESLEITEHVAVSCHDFVGRPTAAAVRALLAEHGFAVRERRPDDTREWARSWLYADRG
jgi:FkbM family methyltransferase